MKNVDDSNFQAEVLAANVPVLVDFAAAWCGPCKRQHPILEQFATIHPEVKVVSLDIDDAPNAARQFSVRSVPTLILFRDGQVANKQVGLTSAKGLEELIKE
jgi:thioredoxin 1